MALVKLNLSGHENEHLEKMGFEYPGAIQIDLEDHNWQQKVLTFIKPFVNSGDVVELVPPALGPLTVVVVTALHGLTGTFPKVVALKRSEQGFVPCEPFDLQDFRNNACRTSRKNVVEL